jgi:hypothetical protein
VREAEENRIEDRGYRDRMDEMRGKGRKRNKVTKPVIGELFR